MCFVPRPPSRFDILANGWKHWSKRNKTATVSWETVAYILSGILKFKYGLQAAKRRLTHVKDEQTRDSPESEQSYNQSRTDDSRVSRAVRESILQVPCRAWSSLVEPGRASIATLTRSPRKRYGLSQFKWGRGPPMRHAVANVLSKTATNAWLHGQNLML